MNFRRTRARRSAVAATLVVALTLVAGCLPPLNPSGEPLEPVPTYVKSVRIDPRTLEPIDTKPIDTKPDAPKPD